MRSRGRGLFLLLLLGLLVSVSIAAGLFPVYANPSEEFDYVDDNLSDVDASPDKGTHSNFLAQQYGPDSIYDTLTEEDTGAGVGSIVVESYSIYESAAGATSYTVDKPSGVVEGDLLIAVMSTDGSGEDHTAPSGWTAIFEDFTTGASTFSVWYKIAATEADNYTFTIGSFESCILSILRMSGHDPTNPINVYGGPDSANTNAPTCPSVITTVDNCLILRIFGADDDDVVEDSGYPSGHTGVFVRGSNEGWMEASAGVAYTTQATAGETGTASFSLTANEQWGAVTIAIRPTIDINYELDLEVQWTNATYTQTYEELCIYGGTMGSENIRVDVWTDSAWQTLFTDLSGEWNNVSVTDYLVDSILTIRFKGGTETSDIAQDTWQIDCTLLHTWGVPPVANFSFSPEYPYQSETVTFNASDSYDLDGSIVSYFWDFGDGTNDTGEIVVHSYADDEVYSVTLTVTDNGGLSNSTSTNVTVLNRSPFVIFTESAETVYTGEPITFNASGSYDPDGSIVSHFWDFGDGANITGEVVAHSYIDDGNYTVTLTVTDDDGAAASASATKTILNRPPVASFTESATTVFTGDVIYFDASGSYDLDGTILSYLWDFGDGTNATGVVVDHAYADNGSYTVVLTVTDDDDATDIDTATKIVLNRLPVASFTESAETVYTDQTIYFNASDSYDSDGFLVSYRWDFGDGTNATGLTTEHSYPQEGNYTVTLTVADDDGATNSITASKTVLNRPPIAVFTESAETVSTDEVVTFNASASYDSDGSIVGYFWDFGDGANSSGVIVEHSYADNGTYTVALTVTDDDGAIDTVSATKTVLNRLPIASFTESAETVYTNETIYFNASASYDPDGSIVGYFWDFGDGANTTGVSVEHSYADDGNYTATLIVTDDDEATDAATSTKTVLNRPPVVSFTESATTVFTGDVIYFNASASYDPDGSIVGYFWDFGDGANSSGVIVEHSYADDGNYTVTLTVTDDDGATDTIAATKTVLNRPPVALFTESAETVYTNEVILFNASDSYDLDGSIVSYFWDFGDGTNFTGVATEHFYAQEGNYTVTLTVTDDDSATNSTSATKMVLNRPPFAIFTESAETVLTDETISFNASASYDPDGSIVGYFWDFGDGTNATGIGVEHSYVDDGNYIVTLTITDDDGTTDSTTASKTVLNRPPVASFIETAETLFTNEIITFNASNSYDPDGTIVNYSWDFGDGTNATGVMVDHSYSDDGNYTLTLTVTDDDGSTDNATATKTVLNRPPVAVFTESAETVLTGEVIYFNASASYDPDGSIVSYFWDFGDGINSSGIIVEHFFVDDGNYTVTLTVTEDDGAIDSAIATKTALNRSPVATFTESAETVYTNETIYFNASGSYDPDGSIVSYFWDFGDGTNFTGVATEHFYAQEGNYTVTLTVTDDDSATNSTSATKMVLNRPPFAIFTESAETVSTGEVIYFNASASYDPDGYIISYFWDFGDGTNATGDTTEHAYADDGNYTVTLTVMDDDGATAFSTSIKTVLNRSPVAAFTESMETALTGETITFNASDSYDADGYIVSYFWDFGDGSNATGAVADHAYADDGVYTVTLTVTDDDDATASTSATKTIFNRPPVALFTESAETVYTSESITLNASGSYDPDGTIVSYFWDFGDATNATGIVTSHAYTDDGTYTVTLVVTDDDGASDITTSSKIILNKSPVAVFTESAEIVVVGETIYFNASDSYDPDGTIVSYSWDFGDGTNATDVTAEHSYADNGFYTVTLTITDDDGETASTTAIKNVQVTPPVAIFTESAETVYTSELIYFNASASYDPDGMIVSYFWGFGDGTNATGVITEHTYMDDGNYTVTLTVTDDDDAINTSTSIKTILNRPAVPLFSETAETVYTSEIIAFNASGSYDPDGMIVSYFWDFGDGFNTTGATVEHSYVDNGTYNVTLTVTDDDSATAIVMSTKTVLNRPPATSFSESAETVLTGTVIYFNGSASYDPDGLIVSYFWNLGDGTNATGVIVEHSYADNGNHTVTLTVTDDDGATDAATSTKTVLNRPPIGLFSESVATVYTSEIIAFNASGSYDPDGMIVSYFWDFGDGTNATGIVVAHSYTDDGNFTVTLTVTDDDGAVAPTSSTKTVLNRPPVATFTESTETVYTSETIYFNASASYDPDGMIVSYFWDFGDGTNATGVNTEHAYMDDGSYTVILKVTDNDGATTTTSATKTVLNRLPVAIFTESAESVFTGEVISFNASDSYDPDGSIVSYFWNFGDGTNSTGIIVDHAYVDDGNYTVTLTVTDNDGASDTTTSTKTVLNRLPIAVFIESAETVYTSEPIAFNASDSYDVDGSIVSYFWNFGDGTNATSTVVNHAYAEDGNYTVTLTVIDDDDATASTSAVKMVLNRPPVAIFTESAESVFTGEVISFNASDSYDPDGSIVSYFWDFGDGTNTTDVIVEHSYGEDGNYTVTLIITDNDVASASVSSIKTILNRSPVASFTESAETIYTSATITFDASASYDLDGSIVSYFWDFGDGTNATGVTLGHSYADDGTYTVTLTVTDNDGATGTATAIKTILNRSPVAIYTESASVVSTGTTIYFDASGSYDPDGVIVDYFWDFSDGTNATGVTVEHSYPDDGNYVVTLTVTDDDGATGVATATKKVLNRLPVASFTESAETVYTSETITFDASGSFDPDGSIVGYFWDFGDSTNATGIIVNHSYPEDGTYIVTLTVTDDDGATASTSATKTVLNRPPVAIFTESAETVVVGETIYFNASNSYDLDGSIVSYFWDFDDGTNATGITTEHEYVDNGFYTVTLTITDNDGATASATATKTVEVTPPVAIFTESAETVYTGEAIYFNASDSYDLDGTIVSHFWDFGDGANATGVTVEHAYVDDGNYTVTLTVTDDDGATGSTTSTKTVMNRLPVPLFTESAETVLTDEVIYFNASASYDSDGYIISSFWDFGDGTNATGVIVEHSYLDDGNYIVILTVMDDDDASDSSSATKTVLNRPPLVIFTESAENVLVSEVIYFNASASYDPDGTIASCFWDFGDGTNATGVAAEHAYVDNGFYTVTLTVTDDNGDTASTSATKTVEITPPVAIFTESAETIYTDETITFNASDSYDHDGILVSYFWDFGDGTNSTGVTVDHSYADDGSYIVTLSVTDDDGAIDTATSTKTVLNRFPVASFTESATTVYTDEVIYFDASNSDDLDGVIISYLWDFGDGTNATGVTVEHAYSDNGNYTVTLTVTDDDGAAAIASATKTVLNRSPVAVFTESAETVLTGEVIYFNATDSYDPDGSIVSYLWDFGDGAYDTGVTAEHSYTDEGTYTVASTVTDDDGATASVTATKIVGNSPPVSMFTESAVSAYTGMVISFDASASYDPDGVVVDYFWDFGDGTNAAGMSMGHAYADDGNYTVTLTVTDDVGATDTTTAAKTILNRSPVAMFTESATVAYTNVLIHFDASTSYDPDGTIVSYFWDFGDGTNATGVIADHAYVDDANYSVTLTLIDDDDATGMAGSTKKVLNRSPVASFTESAETVYTEEIIHFDASASYDPDGSIVSYLWDFGDGTNASGAIVDHTYVAEGTYIVTLVVTDNDGAATSVGATKIVLSTLPIASFTESAEIVYTEEVIYFNASASYDPNGVIVSYFWDFGDSTNATGVTANHAYADDGIYTIILTVTDNEGETSSVTSTKTILNRSPVAVFTESAATVYTGQSITFNASDSYDPDGWIVTYFWDFNDGTNATGVLAEHTYANDGNYTVTLIVTDNDGSVDTAVATKTILNRSPSASFTYSPSYPIVGEVTEFNASTSYDPDGYVLDYKWNFGDGTTTTIATPIVSHTYTIEGDYTVTLTTTDDDSATNNSTDMVTVRNYPTAAFTYSPDTPAKDKSIIFNASSSAPNGGIIISYQWDFGDGNITAVSDPILTHVYSSEGNYTVVLNVTDSEGLGDSVSQTIRVGLSPVSSFTYAPATLYVGDIATFNASESYDPDGSIVSYLWDFGDGSLPLNETDPVTLHVYVSDGSYSVALTVIDNEGISATNSTMITVLRAPVASFTYSPGFALVGDMVTFDASASYDPNGYIMNYTWDFGDGNITAVTTPIITHTYVAEKTYVAILTVTDNEGFTDEKTKFVRIREYPTASFTCIPDYPIAGEDVTFDASSSTPNGGSIENYHWDFGDGSLPLDTTDPILTYLYTAVGDYVVTLTVSDSEDLSDTTSITVSVRDYPTATFQYSPTPPTAGLPVNFDGSSSTPGQGGSITDYAWDFGDNNITTTATPTVVHLYAKAGNYTTVLTVTDSEGLSDVDVRLIIVDQASPVASFVYYPDPAVKDGVVTFNASESYDPDGQIWVYYWRFGDGETDLGWDPSVTHVYTALGQYNVTLTVEDLDENSDSMSRMVTVIAGPHVDFIWEPQYPEIGEVVTFDASESYDPVGSIVDYTWDFGDGNSTIVFEPIITHQYGAPANYTVVLNVTNDQGLWNIRQKLISVIVTGPYVDFLWTPSIPYVNETVMFDASSSKGIAAEIANFTWHFGDGETITAVGSVVYYAYASEGNYTVTLNVTDTRGFWSIASKIISILPLSGPTADFTWPYPCYPNRTITFDASSSTPGWNGTDHPPIVSYTWDFGDGNITTISVFALNHTYVQPGNYTVALTVTDELDQSDTVSYVVTVSEKLLGDVNGDGKVRIDDILAVALAFGSESGDPNWNPDYDVNGDGKVRVDDILIVAQNFGQELP